MSRTPAPRSASTPPAPPHWEKRGNTIWVACAKCDGWVPVEEDLIFAATIDILCPHCGNAFLPERAARIVEP